MTQNHPIQNGLYAICLLMALLVALLSLSSAALAYDGRGIEVEVNKATVVRLPGVANVVAVADPEIADVDVISPEMVSVRGQGVGQTTVVALDGNGNEILNDTVTVTHNITSLNRIIKSLMPGSNVAFESVDGALVMSGDVESPLQAETLTRLATPFLSASGDALVNMLNIQNSDQVLLQVRVVEVSRTELKRFGINLASILSPGGQFTFGLVNGRDLSGTSPGNINRGGDANAIEIDFTSGDFSVTSVLDALAEDDLVKILAEPNLTTASGRSASFLAGGEIPIPVPGQDGQVTIDWREFGVSLDFTPEVIAKDKISLTVAPEVSELTQIGSIQLQGFNIPSLAIRRTETTVELGSGQSFAVAGLLQHGTSNNVSKFPGLGDIPILGALFRSTQYQNEQTELVILITPYIVRGVPNQELATPADGLQSPTDGERILLGRHFHPEDEPPVYQPVENPAKARDMSKSRALNSRVEPVRAEPIPAPVAVTPPTPQPKPQLNGSVGFMVR